MPILNVTQLADHYGVHRQTITSWVRRGMPAEAGGGVGKAYEFDSTKVAAWREQEAVRNAVGDVDQADENELKRRKLAADTTVAEVEAAKARGEVVYIDDAVKEVTAAIYEVKAKLYASPARIAPQIVGETDETRIKDVIQSEFEQALYELQTRFSAVEDDTQE